MLHPLLKNIRHLRTLKKQLLSFEKTVASDFEVFFEKINIHLHEFYKCKFDGKNLHYYLSNQCYNDNPRERINIYTIWDNYPLAVGFGRDDKSWEKIYYIDLEIINDPRKIAFVVYELLSNPVEKFPLYLKNKILISREDFFKRIKFFECVENGESI